MNAYRAYDVIEERKWAEQTLSEEKEKWIEDRAQEIIDALPKEPSGLFRFSVPMDKSPYEGLSSDAAGEAYNDLISCILKTGSRCGDPSRIPPGRKLLPK